ncbi:MAG TPA: ArsA-related P-loop ATPase [Candidatus Binatia bacterium]|nr:ArsA-related P-loop ATPase [Candidatus Binatia bacterium]
MNRIEALLQQKKILLCLGGGGVGKTTISASLALAAALRGRKVALLTIDPAKRLKDALGMPELASEPTRVAIDRLGAAPGGELVASMLDAKRTFDQLVARFAPSLEAAQRILHNRLYQYVSGALAGSQEYMALEKLYEIATADTYDLLIIDTPPTHHALDFLDAPRRMIDLLGSQALSFLQRPSLALFGVGSRIAQAALEAILRALERFTGMKLLAEVADFIGGFEGMVDGFQSRADAVRRLLRDAQTAAVLVTSAEPLTVEETIAFYRELDRAGLCVGAVVMNRTVPEALLGRMRRRANPIPSELRRKLREARHELELLADRDRRMAANLRAAAYGLPIAMVPAFARDVASLESLREIAELFTPGIGRRGKVVSLSR